MIVYHSPRFRDHLTGNHPECPQRTAQIDQSLMAAPWYEQLTRPDWQPVSWEHLERVHPRSYLDQLQRWSQESAGRVESDTVVSEASWDVARLAAGAAVDAVDRVLGGQEPRAMVIARPPGHHALVSAPMGFCLVGNIAIAARYAQQCGAQQVLVVDFDVHHGNGTQDIFWTDPDVGFVSIHRHPFYPGTGTSDQIGTGPGRGWTTNIPVPAATPAAEYVDRFIAAAAQMADRLKPELLLVSAGFDAHQADPVGGLTLESEHFQQLGHQLRQLADRYTRGRMVSLLEGGYHLRYLPESVLAYLEPQVLDQP
jgi:acetoin utilization deacetylase AcuC-like enzyme